MVAPLQSTITLFAEIFVTCIVLYVFYAAYTRGRFIRPLVVFALGYEIVFNISYMILRMATHVSTSSDTPFEIALAALHGTLSLIMFIGLIVFFVVAWRKYARGINHFRAHTKLTIVFVIFWLVSVLSGVVFYLVEYGL